MSYLISKKLTEQQRAETTQRKTVLNSINDKLIKEFESRDLKDIPTDKLVQLIVVLNKQVDSQNVLVNEGNFGKS